jgi:catechol 2,3-dioxygenase
VSNSPTIGIPAPSYRLPDSAHVGRVRLAVSNLQRSIRFYSDVIGLALLKESERSAQLGVSKNKRVLLELEEIPGIRPVGRRSRLGLYHVALLLPSRAALASFMQHVRRLGIPFGTADHIVSEALYFSDPDGLGVEVYADRSRDQWIVRDKEIILDTKAIQSGELQAISQERWTGVPDKTAFGHIHLSVEDLPLAADFYHAALGMNLMTWNFPGALFVAAGEYHHHVGLNVWSAGSPQATEADARMMSWELQLPNEQELQSAVASMSAAGWNSTTKSGKTSTFSDPWRNTVVLASESSVS